MTRKQRRLAMIAGGVSVLAVAVLLVLFAMKDSIVFFNSPTDGGLVAPGSVSRGDALAVRFEGTDGNRAVAVTYQGVLPDLFREGQGIVAEGTLDGAGVFKADNVLAKHDESYMPKEVADALKKQGHWKDEYESKKSSAVQQ